MGQHAACCLAYSTKNPHLLISGGRLDQSMPHGDVWLFNVNLREWNEVRIIVYTHAKNCLAN